MLVSTKCTEARSDYHAALVQLRWPDGFECASCRGHGHCLVNRGARRLFQCNACRKQTSVKAGTIFASSKLPLRIWFKAIFLLTRSKKGISSIELGRRLGVTQTTAWVMKHELAQVMLERNASKRLKGAVQMDDACIGGARPGRRGRGAKGKTPFVAAVAAERTTENPIRSSCGLSKRSALSRSASSPLRRSPPTPAVSTDGLACFAAVADVGCAHAAIKTGAGPRAAKTPAFKCGQHGAGQYQGGFGRNLSSRTFQACSALSRGVRISVQPQIRSRRHDFASRFCGAQDRAHALPAPEVS